MPVRNVVLVYKTGGDYSLEYVSRLVDSIRKHSLPDVKIFCMSDDPNVAEFCEYLPLKNNWPGWWSKLEIFREFKSAVYFDLDTVIRGSIIPLFRYTYHFSMLTDFYNRHKPASGVMAWEGDFSWLEEEFSMAMADDFKTPMAWGDQGYITQKMSERGITPERLQGIFPSMIASYKLKRHDEPIVCFHGLPRPHSVNWEV